MPLAACGSHWYVYVPGSSVTVTLEPGTYTYQCDPHAATGMKGTFEVT